MRFWAVCFCFLFYGCAQKPVEYIPRSFVNLPGWNDQAETVYANTLSICNRVINKPQQKRLHIQNIYGTVSDWRHFCSGFELAENKKKYLERYAVPVELVSANGGLFTGYYSPVFAGSLKQQQRFNVPLRSRPADLIDVYLKDFIADLPPELAHKRVVGHVQAGRLRLYETRAEIEEEGKGEPVVWLEDEVDKFFLQIQGSGRVELADGQRLTVSYAGDNGRSYVAIGKVLVDRGELKAGDVSLFSIRRWLAENPDKREEILNTNPRYIFFRKKEGPITGAYGAPLVAQRSLAVDPAYVPLGVPVFVSTMQTRGNENFNRLMWAHDIGAAITGPVRGDIYFGEGEKAEHLAGVQNSPGRLFVLVPKAVFN